MVKIELNTFAWTLEDESLETYYLNSVISLNIFLNLITQQMLGIQSIVFLFICFGEKISENQEADECSHFKCISTKGVHPHQEGVQILLLGCVSCLFIF